MSKFYTDAHGSKAAVFIRRFNGASHSLYCMSFQ